MFMLCVLIGFLIILRSIWMRSWWLNCWVRWWIFLSFIFIVNFLIILVLVYFVMCSWCVLSVCFIGWVLVWRCVLLILFWKLVLRIWNCFYVFLRIFLGRYLWCFVRCWIGCIGICIICFLVGKGSRIWILVLLILIVLEWCWLSIVVCLYWWIILLCNLLYGVR